MLLTYLRRQKTFNKSAWLSPVQVAKVADYAGLAGKDPDKTPLKRKRQVVREAMEALEQAGFLAGSKWTMKDDRLKIEPPPAPEDTEESEATKPTESAEDVIRRHFKNRRILAEDFSKDIQPVGERLFDAEPAEIAKTLLALLGAIEDTHRKHIQGKLIEVMNGPMTVLERYLQWIEEQQWLKHRTLKLLKIDTDPFKRFRREHARYDPLERDPLTGRSYLQG